MALIWRVQNEKGEGPYNDGWEGGIEMCDAHNDRAHPAPWTDFSDWHAPTFEESMAMWDGMSAKDRLPPEQKRLRFGFVNKADAERWFKGWLGRLSAAGYHLVRVEGEIKDRAKTHSGQVAFLPLHDLHAVDKAA